MKVYGKNVLNEILKNPQKIKKIYLSKNIKDKDLIAKIKDNKIHFENVDMKVLDKMVDGNHQGIVALVDDFTYTEIEKMYQENIVVMLDHLEDPHNFGAIIRTCEAAGIKSIIIPKDRSVDVTPTVIKTSTGAIEHIKIARVNNLVNAINDFKKNGFFVYGAEADGIDYKKCDYAPKTVLVIGSEGFGISKLVRKNCDEIVSLPMKGQVNSLNASVAAAILIYDIITR